jgi:hypothetical protein
MCTRRPAGESAGVDADHRIDDVDDNDDHDHEHDRGAADDGAGRSRHQCTNSRQH